MGSPCQTKSSSSPLSPLAFSSREKEIERSLLDELSLRNGLYRALRIAAGVAEIDAAELARIAADVGARKLTDELRAEREVTNA